MPEIPPLYVWFTIIFAGAITYFFRVFFVLFSDELGIPEWVQKALDFVPPAVLAALVVPQLIYQEGKIQMPWFEGGNLRFIAGILTIIVAWRTKNLLLTLVLGMVFLWLLQGLTVLLAS